MDGIRRIVELRSSTGQPLNFGDVAVTPQSQSLVIRLPFGAFVWNRPIGVIVERQGTEEYIRIIDQTRAVLIGLMVVTLIAGISLLDAVFAASRAALPLALGCVACWGLTLLLQRAVRGT